MYWDVTIVSKKGMQEIFYVWMCIDKKYDWVYQDKGNNVFSERDWRRYVS